MRKLVSVLIAAMLLACLFAVPISAVGEDLITLSAAEMDDVFAPIEQPQQNTEEVPDEGEPSTNDGDADEGAIWGTISVIVIAVLLSTATVVFLIGRRKRR